MPLCSNGNGGGGRAEDNTDRHATDGPM